jgi:hypothetical protein
MAGLLVLTHPGTALAADKASTDGVKTTVLHPTITGTDREVRYSVASLAGGGVQVSFVYAPDEAAGETSGRDTVQSKEFTVNVDAKAVATQTVTDDGGTVVPAAENGSKDSREEDDDAEDSSTTKSTAKPVTKPAGRGGIVKQDVAEDSTKVTLKASTEGVATVWVLPQQAPAAADPDDQGWVSRTWHLLVDKITGSDDSSDTESGDDQDAGDDTTTEAPTAAPTTSPSSTPTSSPSASSSSTSSATTDTGTPEGGEEGTKDGDDTCVVTQGQLTTTLADDGTVNAPLEDGPSAAPTFSKEVQKKAAEQASDCGEGQGDDEQGGDDATDTSTDAPASSGKTKVDVASGDWLSGISGDAEDRAAVEKLRGVPAEVATTWADASGSVSQLGQGSQFGADKWNKSLILALPPFPDGSSWEDTAAGKNDDYLRTTFQTAKVKWGDRDGQLFIEYGYEMNGYWMWWNAKAGQEDAVSKAFARARSIQAEEFPKALLGVRFNHESNGYDGNSEDLIAAVKSSIDFIGASYYNAYPPVATAAEFAERATMRDGGGGPKGIDTWLAAAKTAGLPIEFGEWAESAKDGDSPAFIDGMHQTFQDNAGPGAGQVFAESYFQINKDDDNWRITSGRVPQSAQEYGKQFSDVG